MGERYMEGYYASEDDYMRLFYHYDGETAQRLIILNTINGDVVRLTRQNPVSGCYDMDDRKYEKYHWTCFPISENKFERIWETAPELDLLRDRYVKGCTDLRRWTILIIMENGRNDKSAYIKAKLKNFHRKSPFPKLRTCATSHSPSLILKKISSAQ